MPQQTQREVSDEYAGGLTAADLEFVVRLARDAGSAAMAWFGRASVEMKEGNSPVTEADRESNRIIFSGLRARFPNDGILSEESRDSADRLGLDRVWIVDPLDGTREFLDLVPEFAVMIGLAVRSEAVMGVVYCPADDSLYSATAGTGSWLERQGIRGRLSAEPIHDESGRDPRAAARGQGLRMVGSRSHPDPRLLQFERSLGIRDVRAAGSVGVKCGLIARGDRDVYVHPVPYLKEWDTCAPEVILREAGGTVCDCTGDRLRYNKPSPVQSRGILAAAPGVLPLVLGAAREAFHTQVC